MTFQEYISKVDQEHAERIMKVLRDYAGRDYGQTEESILMQMCKEFIRFAREAGLELVEKDDFR